MSETESTTTIVNIRHTKADVYCGRGSDFGNPYKIGEDGTRDDVCDKFIPYFEKKLRDPKFRDKVLTLRGKKIGCWCLPLRCHLETIKKYLDNLE
jgi:hypothetical protein